MIDILSQYGVVKEEGNALIVDIADCKLSMTVKEAGELEYTDPFPLVKLVPSSFPHIESIKAFRQCTASTIIVHKPHRFMLKRYANSDLLLTPAYKQQSLRRLKKSPVKMQ